MHYMNLEDHYKYAAEMLWKINLGITILNTVQSSYYGIMLLTLAEIGKRQKIL